MPGDEVREFASRWGAIAALRTAGLTVLRVSRWSPGGLNGMQIECAGRRQRVRKRAISAHPRTLWCVERRCCRVCVMCVSCKSREIGVGPLYICTSRRL